MGRVAQIRNALLDRAITGLDRVAGRRGRSSERPAHLLTGVEGERAARVYLQRKGYVVTAQRWSSGNVPGDLDLIAWWGVLLCFVEVKTRTAHDMAPAEAAIDGHKRDVLRRLARQYVRQLPDNSSPQVRFDVVSVYLSPGRATEIAHFENAFGWKERRGSER